LISVAEAYQMPVQEAPRTHLTNYVRLFVELHRLVASGAGNSDQADELRDQLDRPWYKLSDVEMRMTDILAANLYEFDDGRYGKVPDEQLVIDLHLFDIAGLEEAPEAKAVRKELDCRLSRLDGVQGERQRGLLADLRSIGVSREAAAAGSKQAAHDFEAAIKRHEWDLALTILREHESEISPAEVAAMRGICWAQLGNHEIAALFFGEAARQNPTNIEILSCSLRSLIRCGHFDDARRKARFIINKEADPFRLMLAADILSDCIMATGYEATRDEFEEIVNVVDRAAADSTAISDNWNLRQLMCSAYLGAAISCERLGDLRRAENLYRTAHLFYDAGSSPASRASRSDQKWWGGSSLASIIQQERIALCATPIAIAPSLSTN
jgi:tetratricopeptide (TPR) repeat protein